MRVSEYYEDYWAGEYFDPYAPQRTTVFWDRVERLDPRPASFFDLGCGRGELVGEAQRRGLRAAGSDISETAVAQARQSFPDATFTSFPVEDRPWPIEPVDILVSFEVIEHLFWPRDLLEGAREALVPGGHLVISTPYHGVLKNIALALRGFDHHFDVEGQHIRFFTDRALRSLLETSGFDVVSFDHFGRVAGLWANTMVWARRA